MLVHVWLQVPYTVHSSKSGGDRRKPKVWIRKNLPLLLEEEMKPHSFSKVELERRG